MGLSFLAIVLLDLAFIAACILLVAPIAAFRKAAWAVLKRNFVGYFMNPTGYVFLCVFVLASSFAAFWPHEFFTANLANLDQLNAYLPYIMLAFIPAITMSIWSEERKAGTDELLLTLPADDFDIVIGKYLAAAAIFSASLIFSQFSNYIVLAWLTDGHLDTGLFFATYLGYWLIGLAMLAIGMVASFLSSNMTVGYALGWWFNAPLAFAIDADVIVHERYANLARNVSFWSLGAQFDDFGRGVVSLSSLAYFVMVIAVGLYLCMVLIGSRHWSGGGNGPWMFLHFVARAAGLVVMLVAAVLIFDNYDYRLDVSAGRVSSLSPKTRQIIRELEPDYPVRIDAFVGARVPEQYVQTKYNLVSLLKEFDAMSGGKINVRLYENLETFSDTAADAEQRYGIEPMLVRTRTRGAFQDEQVILGAAFNCGLEKVVVPFFDYGVPVEYELTRSIGTVAQGTRKKVGILRTDAQLFGGFSFAGGMPRQIPKQEIVEEIEKQYDVEEVDPTQPIPDDKYDVLIAVQPSSLGPQEMNNFIEVVRSGQPTAIFEDPMPMLYGTVPGTGEPKQAPGGMFGGGGPQPKGDIRELWRVIGIDPPGEPSFHGGFNPDIAWQRYNPYPKLRRIQQINELWVFASNAAPEATQAFNPESQITAGLTEVLFPAPGVIEAASNSDLDFTKLASTTPELDYAGHVSYEKVRAALGDPAGSRLALGRGTGEQILAARIRSVDQDGGDQDAGDKKKNEPPAAGRNSNNRVDVVYVADIDCMISAFLRIRARPDEDEEIDWHFENVNFLLNIVDELSGDDDYVEIRMRKPYHATLRKIEEQAQRARSEEADQREDYEDKYEQKLKDLDEEKQKVLKEYRDRLDELKKKQEQGEAVSLADRLAVEQALQMQEQKINQKHDVTRQQLERELNDQIEEIRREADAEISRIQNWYKVWAVVIPPIPPLLVGLIVFVHRRLREREGVAKSRLR